MKRVKIALWIAVFGFVGLIIAQNWAFFKTENSLLINLFFLEYATPLLANAVFFVAFFFIGLLVSYFFGLFKHYKDAKTIKVLRAKETTLVDAISSLENQLTVLKRKSESVPAEPFERRPVDVVVEPADNAK